MSGETDPPEMDTDPIDADFEPAAPAADFVASPVTEKKGPGWAALGVTGVLAALFGGGIGAVVSGSGGSDYAPETLVEDVQVLAEGQVGQEERLTEMLEDLDTRLRREISTIAAGRGDDDAIAALTTQMAAINDQLEVFEVNAQEDGEAEGLQLDEVLARLEALETLEEDEVASPRVANRAIKSVQRRIEELEVEAATRNETLADLETRLGAAEETLGSGEAGDGEVVEAALLEELRGELDALKDSIGADDEARASENERLTRWVQELRAKDSLNRSLIEESGAGQVAAFSMLSIEAAAREGRPFQSAVVRLEEALPGNNSVAKLKLLAAKGAPTMAMLQSDFVVAREAAVKIIAEAEENGDGWGWVRRALGDAVVVRRSGESSETPADAASFEGLMVEAERNLKARDLEGAIGAVRKLEGRARIPFADWLANARDRQTLEEGLDELRLTLMGTELQTGR